MGVLTATARRTETSPGVNRDKPPYKPAPQLNSFTVRVQLRHAFERNPREFGFALVCRFHTISATALCFSTPLHRKTCGDTNAGSMNVRGPQITLSEIMQRCVTVTMKGGITQELLCHSCPLQEEADIEFIGHSDAAMHLNPFVAHCF